MSEGARLGLVGTENMVQAQAQAYRYSGREGLWIKNMVRGVFAGFGVQCLEEGLCKVKLTHRADRSQLK
jgi:hypothetical protein